MSELKVFRDCVLAIFKMPIVLRANLLQRLGCMEGWVGVCVWCDATRCVRCNCISCRCGCAVLFGALVSVIVLQMRFSNQQHMFCQVLWNCILRVWKCEQATVKVRKVENQSAFFWCLCDLAPLCWERIGSESVCITSCWPPAKLARAPGFWHRRTYKMPWPTSRRGFGLVHSTANLISRWTLCHFGAI